MRTHAYDKPEWRFRNVKFLKEKGRKIWGTDSRLVGSYVELLGDTGGMSYDALEASGVLNHSLRTPFVGVDRDVGVIRKARAVGVPFQTSSNSIEGCLRLMVAGGDLVSVVCYDGYDMVLKDELADHRRIRSITWSFRDVITSSLRHAGEVVFILNHCMRCVGTSDLEALQQHASMVSTLLLGPGQRDSIPASSIDVYRSAGKHNHMATIRVVITRDGVIT